MSDSRTTDAGAVDMPIDGTLDLHTFRPGDAKKLVPDYVRECRERGIREVRIIHGKGSGVLRRIVHAALDRLEEVESYTAAGAGGGGWGATVVTLRPVDGVRRESSACDRHGGPAAGGGHET